MRGGYQAGARSHGRQITKHLEVPNELIGTIIGRHGMKISEIRQAHAPLITVYSYVTVVVTIATIVVC